MVDTGPDDDAEDDDEPDPAADEVCVGTAGLRPGMGTKTS
jgi:hypothetical protein